MARLVPSPKNLWGMMILGGAVAAGIFGLLLVKTTSFADTSGEMPEPPQWREVLSGKKPIRVGLATGATRVSLVCDGPFQISGDSSSRECDAGEVITFSCDLPQEWLLTAKGSATWTITLGDTALPGRFPGAIKIFPSNNGKGITVVNQLPLEQYIAGVIAKEMPASFRMEALRAQAIAARSYSLSYLGRHEAQGFDLCSGGHCHVYRALADPLGRPACAAYSTRGQILLYAGEPIYAVYHSTCGGETADAAFLKINGTTHPYLRSISDAPTAVPSPTKEEHMNGFLAATKKSYCSISGKHRWEKDLTAEEVNALVAQNLATAISQPGLQPGKVKSMRVTGRTGARVDALEIKCDSDTYVVRGDAIRWLFGKKPGDGLQSTFFTLRTIKDTSSGRTKRYTFTGAGWGHGVGLCQWGAEGRARAGATAEEILAAYYPGAELWTDETNQGNGN